LAVDEAGFIQVDDQLRSCSHPQVFAAGDIASMVNHPRPKAGVFAVRQGKPLFRNLRRTVQGLPPIPFRPQRQYLSLIGTGDGLAIASRGRWGWESPLLWRWKDRIDRQFMQKFTNLPGMAPSRPTFQAIFQAPSQEPPMRCAGCGAKVGSAVLQKVLQRIRASADMSTVVVGLEVPDDAAVVQWPSDRLLVQTVDYFSAIVDDPYLVGQISANHALSDIYAMGAMPHSALAIATIPAASASLQEETLYQLMSGAHRVLQAVGATLMGGHTVEGDQLAFGLTCNGLARPDRLLRKGGLQPGQTLILTKPLGIGTLLAAQMRRQAKPAWIEGAIATMLQSNQAAAACFLEHGATACTDITGFGLVGHLVEMLQASQPCAIDLYWQHLPILAGALETAQQGILSSLHPQNLQVASWISNVDAASQHPLYPLLFDPQTSGGLLASVPTAQVSDCLADLRGSGYTASEAIGQIELAETPSIYLV
jgi:selenide,water dikinase